MDALANWFRQLGSSIASFSVRRAQRHSNSESVSAAFIMTVWAVLAGMWAGPIGPLVLLAFGLVVHTIAVESGNHVILWMSTLLLLLFIVMASETRFGGLPPVLLAAASTTALIHNELIRMNYARRRGAEVHDSIFFAAGLAVAGAAAIGIFAVTLAQIAAQGQNRTWLWMPVAVGVLLLIGFGLAIGPGRRPTAADRQRWQPGERLPPQPLGHNDLEP